jgi:hypothetical protein
MVYRLTRPMKVTVWHDEGGELSRYQTRILETGTQVRGSKEKGEIVAYLGKKKMVRLPLDCVEPVG